MLNILCIDDEPMILDLTREFLERSGDLRVEVTTSSFEALRQLNRRVYDAVISDYDMPGMDGIEFLKRVRTIGLNIPFLLFTGKGREEVVIEALNNGADFYIQKGGDVKAQFVELEHKLRQAVSKRDAEYALSVSERHERFLVNIIKQSTQAFVVTYTDGGLGLPNEAFCRLTGYSEEEVKHLNWYHDLTPLEWASKDEQAFKALEMTSEPQRYEKELLRKDGARVPVEMLVHVMKNDAGEVQHYYSFINDVQERKSAEMAKRRAEMAMMTSIDGMAVLDDSGTYTLMNRSHAEIYGYSDPNDLLGRSWKELYDPSEREQFEREHIPQMLKVGFWRGQSTGKKKDGTRFPQEVSLTKLEDGGLICVVRDISELVRNQEALRRSQEELRSVFENALIGIYRTSSEGKVLMANHALMQILGYDSMDDLMTQTDANQVYVGSERTNIIHDIDEEGFIKGRETTWQRKDGSQIIIRDSARAVKDAQGNTLYYEGTVEDVTQRRKVEQALQKANDKLNLLNSITRHDILNQLIVIQGYFTLIKEKDTEGRFHDYVTKIDKALRTIKRQIEFTKDYQKMGVKEAVWQDVRSTFNKAIQAIDLRDVHIEFSGKELEVFADPMFEKVFYNLVDNSLRHGGLVTKIAVEVRAENGNMVLSYSDDGRGIPMQDKTDVFLMGFGRNTGLGLFLVRSILGFTQIDIYENGEEGRGARFEMVVPEGYHRTMNN